MNDHLHPDPELNPVEPNPAERLASAYVDGTATPDEQAQVLSTPEIQALAGSFTSLRADLADVPPAPATARDAAIAAALAEFDTLHAPATPTPTAGTVADTPRAPVISLDSRRRWPNRLMAAAAGLLVVGVVGVAALGTRGNDKGSDAGVTTEDQMRVEVAGGGSPADAPASTIGSIDAPASAAVMINNPQELLALSAAKMAGDTLVSDTSAKSSDTTGAVPNVESTGFVSSSPAAMCLGPDQVFLADILYQGTPAVAALDTVSGMTQAIDGQCNVLAEVAP
jgi:hypothetical protein